MQRQGDTSSIREEAPRQAINILEQQNDSLLGSEPYMRLARTMDYLPIFTPKFKKDIESRLPKRK
jgi:hypothetical protein